MREFLEIHQDKRGKLIEVFKFPNCGQVFFLTSRPGIMRGNHYHTRKIEKFCVIEGKAELNLKERNTDELKRILLSGDKPQVITISPGFTHNILNIGRTELKVLIWCNEIFNPNDPDTFPEEVK